MIRSPRWIEQQTIVKHELRIRYKRSEICIFVRLEFLAHGLEVHRFLDRLEIVWDFWSYGFEERPTVGMLVHGLEQLLHLGGVWTLYQWCYLALHRWCPPAFT